MDPQTVDQEQGRCLREGRRGLRVQGQGRVQDQGGHKEGLRLGRGLGQGADQGQWGSFREGLTVGKGQNEQDQTK